MKEEASFSWPAEQPEVNLGYPRAGYTYSITLLQGCGLIKTGLEAAHPVPRSISCSSVRKKQGIRREHRFPSALGGAP